MAKYVNLAGTGTAHAGTEGDPFSPADFDTDLAGLSAPETYFLKNKGTAPIGNIVQQNVIFDRWPGETEVPVWDFSNQRLNLWTASMSCTFKNIIIDSNISSNPLIWCEATSITVTFENVIAKSNSSIVAGGSANRTISVKGSTFISKGNGVGYGFFGIPSGTLTLTAFDTNYFTGQMDYIFRKGAGGTVSGTYRNIGVYNNSTYDGISNASVTESPASTSIISGGTADQLVDYTTVPLSGDLNNFKLQSSSVLVGAGNSALGLSADIFQVLRPTPPSIGAAEPVSDLNTFDTTPTKGTTVVSTINSTALINKLSDSYFDNATKIKQVIVMYQHEDGRQKKVIIHKGASLNANVLWSTNSQSGVWQKVLIQAFDTDGAIKILNRTDIGTEEDFTLS